MLALRGEAADARTAPWGALNSGLPNLRAQAPRKVDRVEEGLDRIRFSGALLYRSRVQHTQSPVWR